MDNANDLADQKGIPGQVSEIDFAARVNEAIDRALGIEETDSTETP